MSKEVVSSYERVPEGYHNVYIRMYGVDRSKLPQLIKALKAKATLLYIWWIIIKTREKSTNPHFS